MPFLLGSPPSTASCLLIHGFTSWPEEMLWLGVDLSRRGHTVLGVRLPGHATVPRDLRRVHAEDWLMAVEDGVSLLHQMSEAVFVVGFSLGGALALIAAAETSVRGVVTMATPCEPTSLATKLRALAGSAFPMWERFPDARPHPKLGNRHQAVYPAYAVYPARARRQLVRVQELLCRSLPKVDAPVLIVHSKDDPIVDAECAKRIYAQLGTADKRILWLEGFGHSVVRAARRSELFSDIADFIDQHRRS